VAWFRRLAGALFRFRAAWLRRAPAVRRRPGGLALCAVPSGQLRRAVLLRFPRTRGFLRVLPCVAPQSIVVSTGITE
jgi:hypothetical protein